MNRSRSEALLVMMFVAVSLSGQSLGTSGNSSGGNNNLLDAQAILDRCAQAMGSPQHSLSVLAEGESQTAGSASTTPIRIKTRGTEDFRLERDIAGQTEV